MRRGPVHSREETNPLTKFPKFDTFDSNSTSLRCGKMIQNDCKATKIKIICKKYFFSFITSASK